MNTYLPVIADNIPDELKALPRWVVWKPEPVKDKTDEWTKVPYNAKRPSSKASTTASATWAGFEIAHSAYQNGSHVAGVGFVADGKGIVGIDLDKCRDAQTGNLSTEAQILISRFQSYAEISPSGSGIRIFCKGTLKAGARRNGQVEVYDSGRYFTVTGQQVVGTSPDLHERQAELDALVDQLGQNASTPTLPVTLPVVAQPLTPDDAQMIESARSDPAFDRLWSGDTGDYDHDDSRADLALCGRLARLLDHDVARIDSAFRRSG
jgi:putative DNA primase/helicase